LKLPIVISWVDDSRDFLDVEEIGVGAAMMARWLLVVRPGFKVVSMKVHGPTAITTLIGNGAMK